MAPLMHSLQNTWPHVVVTSLRPEVSNCEARSIHTGHVMEDLPMDLGGVLEEAEEEQGERELVAVGVDTWSAGSDGVRLTQDERTN